MRYIIILLILSLATPCYALRLENPPRITDLSNTNDLTILNNYLERLQSIVNGKVNLDVETSAPDWTGAEGDIVGYQDGTNYRIYMYLNGAWRGRSLDL